MRVKNGLLLGLMLLGLAAWISATRDLYLLEDPSERPRDSESGSFIVQGDSLAEISGAIESVGGTVTHELKIIRALGARLTPVQVATLESLGATRIWADRGLSIASDSEPFRPAHQTTCWYCLGQWRPVSAATE